MKPSPLASLAALVVSAGVAAAPGLVRADESGVGFWLPGLFGSMAATPGHPGFSFATVYLHTEPSAKGSETFPRGGRLDAGLQARGDLFAFGPTYTFAQSVFSGQLSLSVLAVAGRSKAEIDATLTGPNGRSLSRGLSDSRTDFGDLFPQAMLKWNQGVHNYMTYVTGGIPVGAYSASRLANLGIGHGAIDGGGGYTFFDPATGFEFSATAGLTYNFENPDTDYQNGIDLHLDVGASKFVMKDLHVGWVGYAYQQITGDSGDGATAGDFKSRVFAVGPQIGYLFPVGDNVQGYVNLKGYKEFLAENRAEGWNVWLALAFTPAPPKHAGQ